VRVIVTGSRNWPEPDAVKAMLSWAFDRWRGEDAFAVVHGACPSGPDTTADAWVGRQWADGWNVKAEPHPADWSNRGNAAGVMRNSEMVKAGADLCLAFIAPCTRERCAGIEPHGSHGASDCARKAEAAGIRTIRMEVRR
jgi:hypothetical protein